MIFSRKRYSISDLPLIIHNLQQALSHTLYYRRQKHTMSSSQYYMYIFPAKADRPDSLVDFPDSNA